MITDPEAVLLCQIPGLNAALMRRLLTRWTTAAAILRAPSSELRALGVPPALISRIVAAPRQLAATVAGLKSLERMGINSVTYLSPSYPQRLSEIGDPPLLLHIQGRWPPPEPSVALIAPEQPDEQTDTLKPFLGKILDLGIGLLVAADDLTLIPAPGSVCVLGYGSLLARSRISETMRATVQNEQATLISVVPINGQSTPTSEALALTVRATLCDGVLLATDTLPATLELRPATFCWSLALQPSAVPTNTTVIKPDDSGLRQITRALGVHRTSTATVQQERLW